MLQDFQIVSDHLGILRIKVLKRRSLNRNFHLKNKCTFCHLFYPEYKLYWSECMTSYQENQCYVVNIALVA